MSTDLDRVRDVLLLDQSVIHTRIPKQVFLDHALLVHSAIGRSQPEMSKHSFLFSLFPLLSPEIRCQTHVVNGGEYAVVQRCSEIDASFQTPIIVSIGRGQIDAQPETSSSHQRTFVQNCAVENAIVS